MMRDQGINLLLIAFFRPVMNAAKGVARQVNGALQGFAGNILVPERTVKEDIEKTIKIFKDSDKELHKRCETEFEALQND